MPQQMQSLVVERPGSLGLAARPVPEPAAGEVRVRVERAGICGSDVHIFHGSNPFARYPRVIGHEFMGRIDAVGEGVATKPGTRVVVDPVVACGHCYACSVGRPNVCASLAVIGVHRDGGFSQFACVPAGNAIAVPESLTDEQAAMIEPFAVAANITEKLQPAQRDIALVYGAGPIGITILQTLKYVFGVSEVISADFIDERLAMARANGADRTVNNREKPLAEVFADPASRPTLVIDAACHPAILPEAISLASPAGRIGILSFSATPSPVTQQQIVSKELTIFSSRLNQRKFPRVIEWMAAGRLHPERLITHRFPAAEYARAFDVFEHDQTGCCKVLLSF